MSRLIAVPVGQGDAFYLESRSSSVLIDGGRSRSGFASIFETATRAPGVDVAVCTHNDADHANGILGFLEAGMRCGEVWLPGRWLGALPNVLKPFVEVFVDLAKSVAQVPAPAGGKQQDGSELSAIEEYAEGLGDSVNQARSNEQGPPVGEDGWPDSYVKMLEQAEPWETWATHWLWTLEDWLRLESAYQPCRHLGPWHAQLLWSAIEAASRIRAIAMEAFHHGVPIRWFEFDVTASSGGTPALPLLPLNARPVARVSPLVGPLIAWLALTVWNKESLVFWCPPTDEHGGVLFTADSDLARISLPRELADAVATAPHHGSESNAQAYSAIGKAVGTVAQSIMWVRSDGRYRSRPGQTYLSLPSPRFCTLCRSPSSSKQAVHFVAHGGVWKPIATRQCHCR